jgi:DNA-binding MarR family transcriptional regulator
MMREGLIDRIPDPDGGMARRFRVTSEGEQRLGSDRADSVRALDAIMANWSPEDVATFAAYLERFNTDIEDYHGRPWPRLAHSALPDRRGQRSPG